MSAEVWSLKRRQGEWHVCDENGLTVAMCGDRVNDAQEIVRDHNTFSELLAEVQKQDCVEACIPGPTDCTDEYRRGWLAALEAAYSRGAGLRAAIAKAVQS